MLFTGVAASHGVFMGNTKLFQVSNLGSGIFPLFPDNASQSTDNPAIEGLEQMFGFVQAVVVPPSDQIPVQGLDDLVQTFPAITVRQSPDSGLKTFNCLSVNPDFGPATHTDEGQSQKFTEPRSTHCAFFLVHLELKLHGNELRDAFIYTLGGFSAFAVNHEVVGISDEFVTTPFQFLIQLVEYDIGE